MMMSQDETKNQPTETLGLPWQVVVAIGKKYEAAKQALLECWEDMPECPARERARSALDALTTAHGGRDAE